MKLINYKCENCNFEYEEIFSDSDISNTIECPKCNSDMKQFNFKNNSQCWKYMDERP